MHVRKLITVVEETKLEMGREIDPPTRKAAAIAVVKNPFAGEYVEDLSDLMNMGEELGGMLGLKCLQALNIGPEQAESYAKGCLVGLDGELEHAAAVLHPKLGKPFRNSLGGGLALIPSIKKRDRQARNWTCLSTIKMPLLSGRILMV